jgi:hypothetical protein
MVLALTAVCFLSGRAFADTLKPRQSVVSEISSRAVLDAIRERRPPFSPEDVVLEFAELLTPTALRRCRATAMPVIGRVNASANVESPMSWRRSQSRTSIEICCLPLPSVAPSYHPCW